MPEETAEGITTGYCATLAMGSMAASPELHGGAAAERAVCAFYTSCCFGEDYKLMRVRLFKVLHIRIPPHARVACV